MEIVYVSQDIPAPDSVKRLFHKGQVLNITLNHLN